MKIILLIIFLSGSRAVLFYWKESYNQFQEYLQVIREGFKPINLLLPNCTCGNCKELLDDEILELQKNAHQERLKKWRENTIVSIAQTLFNTGIVIAAIYYYIILTLN